MSTPIWFWLSVRVKVSARPGPSGPRPCLNPGWSFSESQVRQKSKHGDVGYTVKNRNCSPFNAFSVYEIIGSSLEGDQIRLSISVFTGIITNKELVLSDTHTYPSPDMAYAKKHFLRLIKHLRAILIFYLLNTRARWWISYSKGSNGPAIWDSHALTWPHTSLTLAGSIRGQL